jgi:hypothetical protein
MLTAVAPIIQCFNTQPLIPRASYSKVRFMTATPLEPSNTQHKHEEHILTDAAPTANTEDAFTLLSSLAATTLLQSDRRRDAIGKDIGAQTSATNWIDEGSAFRLRSVLNSLELWMPDYGQGDDSRERQDEAITWLRWLRSIPRPVIVDLSLEARMAANGTVSDDFLQMLNLMSGNDEDKSNATTALSANKMQQIRNEFLNRLGCKLILLPSGQSMQGCLSEPNGSLIFGKLLYGGVTR